MNQPPTAPQRYNSSIGASGKDEADIELELNKTLLDVAATTYKDSGHAIRSVHAKSHGFLKGALEVLPDLPPVLAQGLFVKPGTYDVVMRFSSTPGDILHDKVSTPRGVALKIVGVEGERLIGSENDVTQDFIVVNSPTFNAPSANALLMNLKLLSKTVDSVEGVKKAVSVVLRQVERAIEAFGGESSAIEAMGGEQPKHILGQTYYTQLPLRYGDYIAKLSLEPVSPELVALKNVDIDLASDYFAIRDAILAHFASAGGTWELRVQLCTNLDDMPVDESAKEWSEKESPYVAVARLTFGPQISWSAERSTAVDDGMGFSVWRGLTAHEPLGMLQRMRKITYASSQQFRSQRNATPVREPATLDDFPE